VYCREFSQIHLDCLTFKYFNLAGTWWRLFHRRAVCTKFDIQIFISYDNGGISFRIFHFLFFVVVFLNWSHMKGKRSAFTYIYFCYQTDSGVPNTNIYAAVSLASPYYNYLFHFFFVVVFLNWSHIFVFYPVKCNTVVSNHVNSDHLPSFSCLDI
jgi:hypothetical protein